MQPEEHWLNEQLTLPLAPAAVSGMDDQSVSERLKRLLSGDLDFHEHDSGYATHTIHSFPAKFPPQLPRLFIEHLTRPGDTVLDPMAGSGTTLLEAYLAGRRALGLDIDPLALRIAGAKVAPIHAEQALKTMYQVIERVEESLRLETPEAFRAEFERSFDEETRQFIAYWFAPSVYRTLFYLKKEIEAITHPALRLFFEVVFSSLIITKSGGVSFALDLAHTRPHRAKVVIDAQGQEILREDTEGLSPSRLKLLTKRLRPLLLEFEKRTRTNLRGEIGRDSVTPLPVVVAANAQNLPLADATIDLVVTSPPYASNAIDYMRAHKFALVWFGYPVALLSEYRSRYIGHDGADREGFDQFPAIVQDVLRQLEARDRRKMHAVQRYYREMHRVLSETYRVLRPGKAAIFVVGTSVIRGTDIRIGDCLAAIGEQAGFEVAAIGLRSLDRDRRMLPIGKNHDVSSQIQQRMNQEFVIGFVKPSGGK